MELPTLCNAVFDSDTDYALIVLDTEGRLVKWNPGAARLLLLTEAQTGANCSLTDPVSDTRDLPSREEIERALSTGKSTFDRCYVRTDGTGFWAEGALTLLHDEAGQHIGYLKIFRDATEKHEAVEQLLHASTHDALTGLPNRASFNDHLEESIAAAHRGAGIVLLHLIDLDNYKDVNDRLGHVAGDVLLQKVSAILQASTRSTDYVARLGGDEFAVLQTGARSALAGQDLAQKLVDGLRFPFEFEGRTVNVSASIGIAVVPDGAGDADALFKRADTALFRRKRDGRDGYSFYTDELDREAHDRSHALAAARLAVQDKQFELHYQPKVCAANGRVVAMEALLRCTSERLQGRPISDIIELIRHAGLMLEMSEWIIYRACHDAQAWPVVDGGAKLCVNLSAIELSDKRILAIIDDALDTSGFDRSRFIVELTEQALFDSQATGVLVLDRLKANGVTVALDDFGTGYSSLSYLTTFPIGVLKLDMSLIRELPHSQASCKVVRGIIHLAHTLGIVVVAEGVENRAQQTLLRREHCDELQGFLFSPALDQVAAAELLENPMMLAKRCRSENLSAMK